MISVVRRGITSTHMGRLLLASDRYDDNGASVSSDCGSYFSKRFMMEARNLMHMHRQNSIYLQHRPEETRIPAQMPAGVEHRK